MAVAEFRKRMSRFKRGVEGWRERNCAHPGVRKRWPPYADVCVHGDIVQYRRNDPTQSVGNCFEIFADEIDAFSVFRDREVDTERPQGWQMEGVE